MAEVAVNVLYLTYRNRVEDIMTPWMTDIMRRTNAMLIQHEGALATFAFTKEQDLKRCFDALRRLKYDVIISRTPCFVDSRDIARYEKERAETDEKNKEREDKFLFQLIDDVTKSKTDLEKRVEELERENDRINQIYRMYKQDCTNVLAERDKRIQELSKEVLRLEHRLKEMEEMRMRTYWG